MRPSFPSFTDNDGDLSSCAGQHAIQRNCPVLFTFLSFERNSAEFKGPAVQVKVGLLLDHGEADHQRYILEPPEDGPEDQRLSVSVLTWRFW